MNEFIKHMFEARKHLMDWAEALSIEDCEYLTPEIDEASDAIHNCIRKLCERDGHEPTIDQCGRPEHDYCVFCNEKTPGQAPRNGCEQQRECGS